MPSLPLTPLIYPEPMHPLSWLGQTMKGKRCSLLHLPTRCPSKTLVSFHFPFKTSFTIRTLPTISSLPSIPKLRTHPLPHRSTPTRPASPYFSTMTCFLRGSVSKVYFHLHLPCSALFSIPKFLMTKSPF